MAGYKAQHAHSSKKSLVLPRTAATLAITAGLAVSPLLQTAAFAQDNAAANCGDACKNGTQADWDACKQQVADTKAALEAAQKKAEEAQAKVDAAEKEEARTLKLKNSYTTLYKQAQAAYEAVKGEPAKVDQALENRNNAKKDADQAEADWKKAAEDLKVAEVQKKAADGAVENANKELDKAIQKTNEAAAKANNLKLQLEAAKQESDVKADAVAQAQAKVDAQQKKVDEATAELQAAQAAEEQARAERAAAEQNKAEADAKLEEATAWKQECLENLQTAQKELKSAQDYLKEAQEALEKAQEQRAKDYAAYIAVKAKWDKAISELVSKLDAKNAELENAKTQQKQAEDTYQYALDFQAGRQTLINKANKLKDEADGYVGAAEQARQQLEVEGEKLDSAKQMVEETQKDYQEKSDVYDAKATTYDVANKKLEDMKALAAQVDALSQAKDAAFGAWMDYYYGEFTTAQNAFNAADSDYSAKKAEYDEYVAQLGGKPGEGPAWDAIQQRMDAATQKRQDAKAAYDAAAKKNDDLHAASNQADAKLAQAQEAKKGLEAQAQLVDKLYNEAVDYHKNTLTPAYEAYDQAQKALTKQQGVVDGLQKTYDENVAKQAEALKQYDEVLNTINEGDALVAQLDVLKEKARAAAQTTHEILDERNAIKAEYDAAWAKGKAELGDAYDLVKGDDAAIASAKDVIAFRNGKIDEATADVNANQVAVEQAIARWSQAQHASDKAGVAFRDADGKWASAQAQLQYWYGQRAMLNADLAGLQKDLEAAQKALDSANQNVSELEVAYKAAADAAKEAQEAENKAWDTLKLWQEIQAQKAEDLEVAQATEAGAKKNFDLYADMLQRAEDALESAVADADAAIIKAEATFEHLDGYFNKAVQLGLDVPQLIGEGAEAPASTDLAGRVAVLEGKLTYYANVVVTAGDAYANAQAATAEARDELAAAEEAVAKAQDAYDLAVACYNNCEQNGYHTAKAEETKKDEAKKPEAKKAEKKAEAKKELPATGDSSNQIATAIAVAGVATIAGAEVLRRRKAE